MPGAPKAALTGDALQWVTDHDSYTFTSSGNGDPYRALIAAYPMIANAMNYADLNEDLRTYTLGIWSKIDAAVELGYVAAVAVPVDHPDGPFDNETYYTRNEAINTQASKVAHALWLDVTDAVPWKLSDYTEDELRYLFDTDNLYSSAYETPWNLAGTPAAAQELQCDHSPKMAYDYAIASIGSATNTTQAASALIEWLQRYGHGTNTVSQTLQANEDGSKLTGGCPRASWAFQALARSVNIPVQYVEGKFLDASHANFIIYLGRGVSRVMLHGDDCNGLDFAGSGTGNLTGANPNVRRTIPFETWDPLVGQETDADLIDLESGKLSASTSAAWPTPWVISKFPYVSPQATAGWEYMVCSAIRTFNFNRYFPPYFTIAQQTDFYNLLTAKNPGETGLPSKPAPADVGTSGSLTPDTGQTLSTTSEVYEDMDVTGTLTVAAEFVTIQNCRIDGDGGVGISVNSSIQYLSILNCEITNCTNGVSGFPYYISECYFHSNSGDDILIDGTAPTGDYVYAYVHYNHIDAGSSGHACRVTSPTQHVRLAVNTFVSTASAPVLLFDGAAGGSVQVSRNWINGGDSAIERNLSSCPDFVIDNNRFGRTSTDGLYLSVTSGSDTWYENVYEDDETEALSTDTAPL